MRRSVACLFCTCALLTTAATGASAGTLIPYPNAGTINPETYTFTATATGDIIGYLYSANAADVDSIAMQVNGGAIGPFGIVNTSAVGTTFDFGHVNAGDTITFILKNSTEGFNLSSTPSANADGDQHVYSAPYTNPGPFAVAGIPSGTFVAFEDRLAAPHSPASDFDYNDDTFVFTNVSQTTTPIPGALPLFASGLGALGMLKWRKRRKA